jgi:glucan-binding YG repeat protein
MKKFSKLVVLSLVYALIISLLPANLFAGVAEASEELKEIKVDNKYYSLDAIQYADNKLFLFGAEYIGEGEDAKLGKLKLVVRTGDDTTVVIPESEFSNSLGYVMGNSKDEMYISKWNYKNDTSTVYIVNKMDLSYEVVDSEKFNQAFYQVLENNGYDHNSFDYEYLEFNHQSNWLMLDKDNEYDDETWETTKPGEMVVVNARGAVIHFPYEYNEDYEMYTSSLEYYHISTSGDLYYIDNKSKKLVVVKPNGTKHVYTLPSQVLSLEYLNDIFVDKYNRVYIYGWEEDTELDQYYVMALNEEEGTAQFLQTVDADLSDRQISEDGTLWYKVWVEGDNYDDYTFTYGYLSEDLNPVDMYISSEWGQFQVYGNNIVIYNRDGYGLSNEYTAAKNGWVKENNIWYYYKGNVKQTGWLKDGGKWYFLDSTGLMKTGWAKSGGRWYFMSSSGEMKTGWLKLGSKWYFLASSGEMKTGWVKSGDKWYFMTSSGEMKTGWLKSVSKWYYLNTSGSMDTGWKAIGGKWYYFYSSGVMAANTTIDGYKLGSNGAWVH